ncbi:MAG TPA: aminomethyl-transferring glycine dehydrogenase subunit GcvPB [Candidatus Polarisedimenticolia bacterium]|nr:aminomethyl-transferring glycine dehydrogenase subunit GcvPB [Candidatus Polarisedimenticolia bacterium]
MSVPKVPPKRPEGLLFEQSTPGKRGCEVPAAQVPAAAPLDPRFTRETIEGFPELSEREVVRHFTRISRLNYGNDEGLYPLGSCTMKYNPKVNEKAARLEGFAEAHPLVPEEAAQGSLRVLSELERFLCEIAGMDAFTLQPAAGAQGELTGIRMVRAFHESRGNPRQVVLIPDSAHGTNPASAHLCGYRVEEIGSDPRGCVDLPHLRERMSEDVAVLMLTNPNTLGVFETEIGEICRVVHERGGMVYLDGANLNAFVGVARPGDMGADVMHVNLHKTFSTPHGGGGPGSGPVGVKEPLARFLPVPRVVRTEAGYRWRSDFPDSIGRVHAFHGNFGMVLRAYAYILANGAAGLREIAETAVLNANYVRKQLEGTYHLPYSSPTLHEVIFSDRNLEKHGVRTLDVAKRLMDYGFHPPTIYFPLIVKGALMIEPTESEGIRELDAFIEAMIRIAREAEEDPEILRTAPHSTPIGRLDEAAAARKPILRWTPAASKGEA